LLEEAGQRLKRRPPEVADNGDAAELFELAQRLRTLRSVHAPARLRARALADVRGVPYALPPAAHLVADEDSADLALAQRLRHLRAVRAPDRLRARALAGTRDWQNMPRVVPLASRRQDGLTWVRLAGRAVAAAAIVISAGYGTIAASASSLPGNPLYSVKLIVEDVRVAVASPNERPRIYVEQADNRLEETQRLLHNGQYPEAERTVREAQQSLDSARALASQSARPQETLSAIDDASVRTQRVADLVVQAAAPSAQRISGSTSPAIVPPAERNAITLPESAAPAIGRPESGAASLAAPDAARGQNPAIAPPASNAVPIEAAPSQNVANSAAASSAVAPSGLDETLYL
jgi:hypothetical protein